MSRGFSRAINSRWRDIVALVTAVLLTRWLFMAEYLVHMDSVNFALGIVDYNPVVHQPHPPGYYLYVLLGKLLTYYTHDPVLALFLISISASSAGIVFLYLLTLEWFGRRAALYSGLLFLTSPFCLFYGTVGLTYIVEFSLATLVGLLCWHVSQGQPRYLIAAAIVLGVTVGFRQSAILFLAPLCLYSLRHYSIRYWSTAILVFVVTVLAWFLPMLAGIGGGEGYFTSLHDLWVRVPSTKTVYATVEKHDLLSGLLISMARMVLIVFFFVASFTAAAPLILMRSLALQAWDAQKRFAYIWILPGLLFFILIFLSFSNMGYMAVIYPPLFAIIAAKLTIWHGQLTGRLAKSGLAAFFILANLLCFNYAPVYFGYQNTRDYENDIARTSSILKDTFNPSDTLIVATDVVRYGFREAGYYSPDFLVIQYPEVAISSGNRVFAMQNRQTLLLDNIPTGKYSKFALYPTPRHSYKQEELWNKFPEGHVNKLRINGYEFIEGEISELQYLFPHVARQ